MHKILAVLLTASLSVFALGCGGDDDEEASTTTEAPAEDEGGDEDESSSGAGAFNSEDCQELQDAFQDAANAAGSSPSEGPENLDETREFFEELADEVPSEIRDDFETYAEAVGDYFERLADLDIDSENPDPDDVQEAIQAAQALATSDVVEASTNISQFIAEGCGAN